MKMKKIFIALLIVTIITMCFVGCGNTSSSSKSDPTQLNFALTTEPATLDPAFNYDQGEFYCIPQVCESLLVFDSDCNLKPNLAKSWEAVDSTTYVYQIRDDVKFSDGTDMTVDDVVYCMNRILDPNTGSSVTFLMENVESVEATGDWEVTVKLSKPDVSWQYMPATAVGQIYSKKSCEEAGEAFGTSSGGIVGTGAYKLDSWKDGSEINLSINDYYWAGADNVDVKKITYKFFTDDNAQYIAAKNGEIDVALDIASDYYDQFSKISRFNIQDSPALQAKGYYFNTKSEYTSDINVRKAIASIVDDDAYIKAAYSGRAEKSTGLMFNENVYGTEPELWKEYADNFKYKYEFDVDKAKEYLSQSAYPEGGFTLDLYCRGFVEAEKKLSQIIQYGCKEYLNITVNITEVSAADFGAMCFGGNYDSNGVRGYDILVFGWNPDYVDPAAYLNVIFNSAYDNPGGSNFSSYRNEKVDELFKEQNETMDFKERSKLLMEANDLIQADCAYRFVAYNNRTFVLDSKYEYKFSPIFIWNLYVKDFKIKSE